ncbi:MAG: hypothetical protein ACI9VM_000792 [Candidatus Azotimanducaceae bacterium]|jgi:hypothetical protein
MENETQEQGVVQVEQPSPLHQVTPLSKYLALALFVILPFIGGWIGYTYAPEKVVEVIRVEEKVVGVEDYIQSLQDSTDNELPFSNPDVTFYLKDLKLETEAVLASSSLSWRQRDQFNPYEWDEWSSVHIINPSTLRYVGKGVFTDGEEVYRLEGLWAIIIPEYIELDASAGIEIFVEKEVTFVKNGERFFVEVPVGLSWPYLRELTNFNKDELEVLGYNHISDGESIYSIFTFANGEGVPIKLEGANPDNFVFYLLNDSDHPSDVFGVSEEKLYSNGLLLEDIDFSESEFLMGNAIVKDADTVWFKDGGCHFGSYRRGTLDEIDTYRAPC